nr:MAG TPA: hypothetical protein [Caudoviricetes sp.]
MILKFGEDKEFVGVVGEETILTDVNNRNLYVGDMVYIDCLDCYLVGQVAIVCHDNEYGDYIMGLAEASKKLKDGVIDDCYTITKIRDYKNIKERTKIEEILFCKEDEE